MIISIKLPTAIVLIRNILSYVLSGKLRCIHKIMIMSYLYFVIDPRLLTFSELRCHLYNYNLVLYSYAHNKESGPLSYVQCGTGHYSLIKKVSEEEVHWTASFLVANSHSSNSCSWSVSLSVCLSVGWSPVVTVHLVH